MLILRSELLAERVNSEPDEPNAAVGLLGDEWGTLWDRAEQLRRAVAGRDLEGLHLYIIS